MELTGTIRFDSNERRDIIRAIGGRHGNLTDAEGQGILRTFENRVKSNDFFRHDELVRGLEALTVLADDLTPKCDPAWWRETAKAPGGDDAVEGLAKESAVALEAIEQIRVLIADAVEQTRWPVIPGKLTSGMILRQHAGSGEIEGLCKIEISSTVGISGFASIIEVHPEGKDETVYVVYNAADVIEPVARKIVEEEIEPGDARKVVSTT